jgi:hypothetical protein
VGVCHEYHAVDFAANTRLDPEILSCTVTVHEVPRMMIK